jgi:hypothetical protein
MGYVFFLFLGIMVLWIRFKGRYSLFRIFGKWKMAITVGRIAYLNTLLVIIAVLCFGAVLIGLFRGIIDLF